MNDCCFQNVWSLLSLSRHIWDIISENWGWWMWGMQADVSGRAAASVTWLGKHKWSLGPVWEAPVALIKKIQKQSFPSSEFFSMFSSVKKQKQMLCVFLQGFLPCLNSRPAAFLPVFSYFAVGFLFLKTQSVHAYMNTLFHLYTQTRFWTRASYK